LPSLAHGAGVGTSVDVVVHEALSAPITCGVVRPFILLPPDAHEWPPSALSRALVHELEHVKRRDWAVQTLARIVCAVYWFHPLVWFAYRQLCLQAEHACDDAVVLRSEDTSYADQLVTLARRMAARPAVAVLGMAQRSDLAARVSAVLDASRSRGRAGMVRAGGIAVAALVVLVTVAPLQVVAASSSAEADLLRQRGESRSSSSNVVPADVGTDAQASRGGRASRLDRVLVEAADEGDLLDVRELLDTGGNVNAAVPGDGSPLIAAARSGHIELVRLLLDRGADVNLGVSGDGAPLIMAAREGHVAVVQLLLDSGAIVDLAVAGDENALIQASAEGQLAVVRLLVARGADVNARIWVERLFNQSGGEWRTPLNVATRGGHRDVVAFLRSSGAVE
jgi:bla regulator protein blaR1